MDTMLPSSALNSSSCCRIEGKVLTFNLAERFSRMVITNKKPGVEFPGERPSRSQGGGEERGGSCGSRKKTWFGLQLAASDLLELELPQRGRIITPTGNAALFDAERMRQFRLRPVVFDCFVCRHTYP